MKIDTEKLLLKLLKYDGMEEMRDALTLCRELIDQDAEEVVNGRGEVIVKNRNAEIVKRVLDYLLLIRRKCVPYLKKGVEEAENIYWNSLLIAALHDFDCYCRYIEKDREPRKRFYEPRRKQLLPIAKAMQRLEENEIDILAISLPPGVGKALANDTPVMTSNGWKKHGDLQVGDFVVGMDGQYKKVIAVHPKCMVDCEVEFTNGEKIVCHENHEWMVYDRPNRKNHEYVAETKYLESRSLESGGTQKKRGHRYNIQLPHKKPMVGIPTAFPIDPYSFGVWLGNGTNKNPTITCDQRDVCVIDRMVRNGRRVRWRALHKDTGVLSVGFDFREALATMGLCHSRKTNRKYIPEEFLTASVPERLDLLAGLLDTDGTLSGSKYQFSTTDETLRDSMLDLLATFGWRGCLVTEEPKTSSSGIHGRKPVYVISFTPDIEIPCELPRKRNVVPHKQRAIAFKSIKRVSPVEGNCITVEDDGMYLVGKTMLPTHNSTLEIFFMTWVAGLHPEMQNLMGSHNSEFLRGVYDECLRIFDRDGEYRWCDVFNGISVSKMNAKSMRIDLGRKKRFETIEFSSIGSGNAGKVRATAYLLLDDLCEGIEQAMSVDRMNKLWQTYTVDYRQRKLGDRVKEIHIQTRWSVNDVVGRLQELYAEDPRAEFINVPALDENGNSNFDYPYGLGYTKEMLEDIERSMDDASFRALYMGEPIEREGRLIHPSELRRYFELPEREPDAILSACDTKDRGDDYCVMPIAYQYGSDYYIEDVVCSNGKPEIVESMLVEILLKHKVQISQFESNAAGGRVAQKIQDEVKQRGGITKIITKYNQKNKETRILTASPYIKEHFLFKDETRYKKDKVYGAFIGQLCSYTMSGRNKHDDAVDAMSQFVDMVQGMSYGRAEVFSRPW